MLGPKTWWLNVRRVTFEAWNDGLEIHIRACCHLQLREITYVNPHCYNFTPPHWVFCNGICTHNCHGIFSYYKLFTNHSNIHAYMSNASQSNGNTIIITFIISDVPTCMYKIWTKLTILIYWSDNQWWQVRWCVNFKGA